MHLIQLFRARRAVRSLYRQHALEIDQREMAEQYF
jgi:hypothetical protein